MPVPAAVCGHGGRYHRGMAYLLYDADCGFCRLSVRWFGRLIRPGTVVLPLQEFTSDDPRLSQTELRRAIKLVLPDGRVYSGAEALVQAVGGVAPPLYYLPVIRWLADTLYAWVARNRKSLPGGCDSMGCPVSQP